MAPSQSNIGPRETGERLHKILAAAGISSRRKCEEYVLAGRVTVDGEVVTDLAYRVEPGEHDVRLDGERLRPQAKRYFLLNKPQGVLCTNYDPRGRVRAVDLIPANETRLFTVGRLDESSEGLLIVTNDGDLAQKLAHPKFQVPRVYKVQVAGLPSRETLAELKKGLFFTEGKFAVQRVRVLRAHGKSSFVEVELTQGHNREIRRLFARVGHKVMWLQRIAFGPLKLGELAPGKFRPLTGPEIKALASLASGVAAPRRRVKKAASSATKKPRDTKLIVERSARRVLDLTSDAPARPEHSEKKKPVKRTAGGTTRQAGRAGKPAKRKAVRKRSG